MTPKQKAKQLVESMAFSCRECDYEERAKQSALIAVDEIIEATSIKYEFRDAELLYAGKKPMQYWLDVKKEIEKL